VALGECVVCNAVAVRNRDENPLDRAFLPDLLERVV
jgi:hypothetical protein